MKNITRKIGKELEIRALNKLSDEIENIVESTLECYVWDILTTQIDNQVNTQLGRQVHIEVQDNLVN